MLILCSDDGRDAEKLQQKKLKFKHGKSGTSACFSIILALGIARICGSPVPDDVTQASLVATPDVSASEVPLAVSTVDVSAITETTTSTEGIHCNTSPDTTAEAITHEISTQSSGSSLATGASETDKTNKTDSPVTIQHSEESTQQTTPLVEVLPSKVNGSNVCSTPECIRTAENLKKTMDLSVHPCDNFYQYVCGNFNKSFPIKEGERSRDWFAERLNEIVKEIEEFLEKNDTDVKSAAVRKARSLYSSCADVKKMNSKALRVIEDVLKKVNLPLKVESKKEDVDWIPIAAGIKRIIGQNVFFAIGVGSDPNNRAVKRITIRKPSSDPDDILNQRSRLIQFKPNNRANAAVNSNEYNNYANSMVGLLFNGVLISNEVDNGVPGPVEKLSADISSYALKKSKLLEKYADKSVGHKIMTLQELQTLTDGIAVRLNGSSVVNWTSYLHHIFHDIDGIDLTFGNGSQPLVIYDLEYIKDTISLIAEMSTSTVEKALWWEVVNYLAPHANEQIRKMRNKINNEVEDDKRSFYCTKRVTRKMGLAISYYLASDPKFGILRDNVIEMVNYIQASFDKILEKNSWMDDITRQYALDKERSMEAAYIAYPSWLSDESMIDEHYAWMDDLPDYLDNELQYLKLTTKSSLENLIIRDNPNDTLIMNPIEVNACYDPDHNAVTLPAGILGYPFYRYGLEAMNYGGIGLVIGHEITHGFDDSGRQYDKDGNIKDWWENSTEIQYIEKSKCFVDAYSEFVVVPKFNKTLSGERTLDENIADNGGFREALLAYRKYVAEHGTEPLLPGFENYTHEQLYTMAVANVQCEAFSDGGVGYIPFDVHSPGPARVWGMVRNSAEFAAIWSCNKGTEMNPDNKCRVW